MKKPVLKINLNKNGKNVGQCWSGEQQVDLVRAPLASAASLRLGSTMLLGISLSAFILSVLLAFYTCVDYDNGDKDSKDDKDDKDDKYDKYDKDDNGDKDLKDDNGDKGC